MVSLLKGLIKHSPYRLTSNDLVPIDLQREISDFGQFAELAHGSLSPDFIWNNLEQFSKQGLPLENYTALRGSKILRAFIGDEAKLQGYVAYRPELRQLIIAFSGTCSFAQAINNFHFIGKSYPHSYNDFHQAWIHSGFWHVYQGVKNYALSELEIALNTLDIVEVVLTGHSLGGALSCLLAMDIMQTALPTGLSNWTPPKGLHIRIITFGSPRIGNLPFVELYQKLVTDYRRQNGETSVSEIAVKAYNDIIPCLPLLAFGYRHVISQPIYAYHGSLYHIPPSENEYSKFLVDVGDKTNIPRFPLGGHNYYNDRDMEACLRHLGWLTSQFISEVGWEERYLQKKAKEGP